MVAGFTIWSIVALVLVGIGIGVWKSDRATGFYAGAKPPQVRCVRKYNRSVALLWFAYAVVFELLGLPLLFLKQNAAGFLGIVPGVPVISIALMIAYNRILRSFQSKEQGDRLSGEKPDSVSTGKQTKRNDQQKG